MWAARWVGSWRWSRSGGSTYLKMIEQSDPERRFSVADRCMPQGAGEGYETSSY
jgi:hypothetical protein